MELLFIDACPREANVSRTHALCRAFLAGLRPDIHVETVSLRALALAPYTEADVGRREECIERGDFGDELFAQAWKLRRADMILIGAPYWDLSFPACLKVYFEHVFAREVTFRYTEAGLPVGLCRAGRAAFLTTAGGFIGENDFGAQYVRAALHMLGVARMDTVRAEGLDIWGADAAALLAEAVERARVLAATF